MILIVSDSAKYNQKITSQTENNGRKDVQTIVPLKYLSNFWRVPEILLINFEITIIFNLV